MIYKLIVNAAFLAVGYYIGKQVALRETADQPQAKPAPRTAAERSSSRAPA